MPTKAEQGAIWVPIEQYMPLILSQRGQLQQMLIQNRKAAADLSQIFGGRAAKPNGMLQIPAADGVTPIMIPAMGEAEVAQIEELALRAYEETQEQVKKTGTAIDFDAERERAGLPPAETFDTRVREHMQARADAGRRNFRSAAGTPLSKLQLTRGQTQQVMPAKPWEPD